jgi:hypothetical protein
LQLLAKGTSELSRFLTSFSGGNILYPKKEASSRVEKKIEENGR